MQPLPALPGLFCKRAPLNLPAAAQSSTSLSSKTSKCSRPRLYYVVGFFFVPFRVRFALVKKKRKDLHGQGFIFFAILQGIVVDLSGLRFGFCRSPLVF